MESLNRLQSDDFRAAFLKRSSPSIRRATVIACNLATERLFGWTADELIGQNVKVLMAEPYHPSTTLMSSAGVDGGPRRIIGTEREVRPRRRDVNLFPAELAVSKSDSTITDCSSASFATSPNARPPRRPEKTPGSLVVYYDQTESEQQLAIRLIEKQMHRRGLGSQPAATRSSRP